MKRYAVVFEKSPDNWGAYVPGLPGCVTTGKTLDETRKLIAEAIQFHIEGLRLHGSPVPEPSARAEELKSGMRPEVYQATQLRAGGVPLYP